MTKSRSAILASPMLCLGVLACIAADNARHVKAKDAVPYHARALAAVNNFPYVIGYWTGTDNTATAVPEAAVKLLRPNVIVSRHYVNQGETLNAAPGNGSSVQSEFREAFVLIVQCADSRDMTGHYPPICYPSNGEPLLDKRDFSIKCGDVQVAGTEYTFDNRRKHDGMLRKSVYDFFVVPGRGIVRDITDVRAAAGDYQRRCFGAAQFQVVMNADLPPEERDSIFSTLVGSDTDLIKVLKNPD